MPFVRWPTGCPVTTQTSRERGSTRPPSTVAWVTSASTRQPSRPVGVPENQAVAWLEQDFTVRKAMGMEENPSERQLFQIIEDHYAWCKCERGGDNAAHTKSSSTITFDYNEYLEEWQIPSDEEPPRWIA